MGRPKQYDTEHHRSLRARVAKFRQANAPRLRQEYEQQRLLVSGQHGGHKGKHYYLYESVNEAGQILDVIITTSAEPPIGARISQWLPRWPMSKPMATIFRESRIKQIAEWCQRSVQAHDN